MPPVPSEMATSEMTTAFCTDGRANASPVTAPAPVRFPTNVAAPVLGLMRYRGGEIGLLSLVAATRAELRYESSIFDLNRHINDGSIPLGRDFYRDAATVITQGSPEIIGFMTECDSYHHVLQICENIGRIGKKDQPQKSSDGDHKIQKLFLP